MARLSLRNLSKAYGEVAALRDVSLDINDHEFFVLLGPTGAGKTTTLRCIAGLEKPESGEIRIDNDIVNEGSAAQRDVAGVSAVFALSELHCARDLESRSSRNWRTPAESSGECSLAETVRIEHLLDRRTEIDCRVGECNGFPSDGRSCEPRLFLMDEPLSI
jgi:multiple sugar transport system ATP-binding protein